MDLAEHPYTVDLDLFGHASVFQWLGPAATPRRQTTLADWLLRPASRSEIVARQAATSSSRREDEWRLRLEAHGLLAAGAGRPNRSLLDGPDAFSQHSTALRAVVFTLVAAIWILIALHATGVMSVALWPIPLVAGIILSFVTAVRVRIAFRSSRRWSGCTRAIRRNLSSMESPHHVGRRDWSRSSNVFRPMVAASMRRLNRILGYAELRRGAAMLHFPVQAFTLWDFHVLFALERWRVSSGRRVRGWLDALGELEALNLLATARRDNPGWVAPEFGSAREVVADDGHPLILDNRRVANSVRMGPPGSVLLITGSNMSGKSAPAVDRSQHRSRPCRELRLRAPTCRCPTVTCRPASV